MAENVFEVKDYASECKPFKFKLPGDDTIYGLKPLGLLRPDEVAEIYSLQTKEDLGAMCELIAVDEKSVKALKSLPLIAFKDLSEAWKDQAGITLGE